MASAMTRCPLFCGLSDAEVEKAFAFFGARRATYRRGAFLIHPGDALRFFGLVLSGSIEVMMDDMDGHHMIMATASAGDTFGESMCYLAVDSSPVYICAVCDAQVLWMGVDGIKTASGDDPFARKMTDRFIRMLAERTLSMNDRIQTLSKSTLRGKLTTLFSQFLARAHGDTFLVPFDRSSMAAYLGTNRCALSRELSNMRAEGLIEFEKNRFTVRRDADPASNPSESAQ
ncbi:MAG: Crp/Fnr family transcriptional regulator [Clostridia bacterium]